MLAVPQSIGNTKAHMQTIDDPQDLIGRWDDPNPSTQLQPRTHQLVAQEIEEAQDATNANNPFFHTNQSRVFKGDYGMDYIAQDKTDQSAEATEFFYNTTASGEDYLEQEFGRNPIHNANVIQEKLRFSGSLFDLPNVSLIHAPGTHIAYSLPTTIWDKQGLKVPTATLDIPLSRESHNFGEAALRPDTQISSKNTDTLFDPNPLKIGIYNDRAELFDENREKF